MKRLASLIVLVSIFTFEKGISQNLASFFDEADAVFSVYVSNGKVDYTGLSQDASKLEKALNTAAKISVAPSDSKNYQAFWINAYNLAVIKGIVDNYPIASPLDKKGFFDKTEYKLGGTTVTLNDIENKKLRANFNEPRFHFVLVCGALGCPPIIAEAYTPDNLETLLQLQTVKALNDSNFIRVKEGKVAFSEIFKWYKEDFVKNGTEIDFLNSYRKEKVPTDAKVTYYSYDWRLNSK